MVNYITDWVISNYIEIVAVVTGFIYIFLSIRQNILLWPVGIVSAAFFIFVYAGSKIYADMSLQVYYLLISVYGWLNWKKTGKDNKKTLQVSRIGTQIGILSTFAILALFAVFVVILKKYTDSDVPYLDAFTTAASIVATWMLTKKIIEHWLLWVIVDIVSVGLYLYKALYLTTILYFAFTIFAVVGFYKWKVELKRNDEHQI